MKRHARSLLALLSISIIALLVMIWMLPDLTHAIKASAPLRGSPIVYAKDNSPLFSRRVRHSASLRLSEISPDFIQLLLETKDPDHYIKSGKNRLQAFKAKDPGETFSEEGTLTRQLARMLCNHDSSSMWDWIREEWMVIQLNTIHNKDEIVELYANRAYFGSGVFGVGAASQLYFGKAARKLTLTEAAFLVGLLHLPQHPDPFENPIPAIQQRNAILRYSAFIHVLPSEVVEIYATEPPGLNPEGKSLVWLDKVPNFNRYVLREARERLNLGEGELRGRDMRIYTTLDPKLQDVAENELAMWTGLNGNPEDAPAAALLSMDAEGRILAFASRNIPSLFRLKPSADRALKSHHIQMRPYAIEKILVDGKRVYARAEDKEALAEQMRHAPSGVERFQAPDDWLVASTPNMTTGIWVDDKTITRSAGMVAWSLPVNIWQSYQARLAENANRPKHFLASTVSSLKLPSSSNDEAAKPAKQHKSARSAQRRIVKAVANQPSIARCRGKKRRRGKRRYQPVKWMQVQTPKYALPKSVEYNYTIPVSYHGYSPARQVVRIEPPRREGKLKRAFAKVKGKLKSFLEKLD